MQWRKLKYLLSHGVKEGLVESPYDWPGVHAAHSLVSGEPLEVKDGAQWISRSEIDSAPPADTTTQL